MSLLPFSSLIGEVPLLMLLLFTAYTQTSGPPLHKWRHNKSRVTLWTWGWTGTDYTWGQIWKTIKGVQTYCYYKYECYCPFLRYRGFKDAPRMVSDSECSNDRQPQIQNKISTKNLSMNCVVHAIIFLHMHMLSTISKYEVRNGYSPITLWHVTNQWSLG